MTKPQQDFVDLCAQLRLLGATEVSCGDMSAKFEGRVSVAKPTEHQEPQRPLTPEQAKELAYAQELGRV